MGRYEVKGWKAFSEEDIFEHGCQPDSGNSWDGPERFSANSVEQLLVQLIHFVDAPEDAVLLDACDVPGRVDVAVLQTDLGATATEKELKQWKALGIKLYHTVYTFQVEWVTRVSLELKQ